MYDREIKSKTQAAQRFSSVPRKTKIKITVKHSCECEFCDKIRYFELCFILRHWLLWAQKKQKKKTRNQEKPKIFKYTRRPIKLDYFQFLSSCNNTVVFLFLFLSLDLDWSLWLTIFNGNENILYETMKPAVINNNSETPTQSHHEPTNQQGNNGQLNNDHTRRFPEFRVSV